MKHTIQLMAAIAIAATKWCVMAATVTIQSPQNDADWAHKLTNAVATAQQGDVIVLERGTYIFPDDVFMADNTLASTSASYCKIRLNVTTPNITIKGEDDSGRRTWTHGSEPVIIDGNGGKAMQLQLGANEAVRIENITFANCNGGAESGDSVYGNWCNGGAIGVGRLLYNNKYSTGGDNVVVTNCVFRGNRACLGGAIGSSNHYFVQDCFFTNNVPVRGNGAGCMYYGRAYGCDFIGNESVGKNVAEFENCRITGNCTTSDRAALVVDAAGSYRVEDCQFVQNGYSGTSGGGAIRLTRVSGKLCSMTIKNCTFEGNVAYSTGGAIYAGNSVSGESAWDGVTVLDSTFTSNRATNVAGVYGVRAKKCTFDGNIRNSPEADYSIGNAARYSYLEECELNDGDIVDCVIDRCRIHDIPENVRAVFRGLTRCTNSIVESCSMNSSQGALLAMRSGIVFDAEFVNCTFVANRMYTIRGSAASSLVGATFANCLFNGNYHEYGVSDISAYDASSGSMFGYLSMSHSYYERFAPSAAHGPVADFASLTNATDSLTLCADPKFVKDSSANAPYWSLSLKSPLLGKGDPLDFSDSDLDLAGKQRLKDGEIDIGCYQCWLKSSGLVLFVR